ncbi:Zn-dependent peptidase ImmA (M78 family)/transcriptional regulator with XRE-family HTH domain [Acidovorax soli]|uniref:Zn-dependent peptidase ImmA (M78 family)/transcriptional regulator with XRE-family HTH domain n=1 Tax=Acidovorax soli TaxID=592050 RepID=A0A7X0UC15_9BURK|nr:ImmA/IrrE family metallo-endopeptidase [Acidovorax soli]MBB6562936.1 Zn-dependent peptidase ImmA (M78 family)/transcriptional regulator with XRE-family HTH domain [Acidovorax soli]
MTNIAAHLASKSLTVEKAAKKAGITPDRFQQVVGGAKATLGEMRGIAKALQIPLSSLMDGRRETAEPIKMLFRQTLEQREAVEVSSHIDVLSSQVRDALSVARGRSSDLSWLDIFKGMDATPDAASEFADLFRKTFADIDDLEPFPHLAQVLADMGVWLLFSRDPTVEGVSAIVEGHAIVIIGPRTFKPRMLFTLAHELGHLVAHHDARKQGYAHMDKEADWSRSPRRAEEKFADAFASALLLPKHGVLSALKAVRDQLGISQQPLGAAEIAWIGHIFHVSFEVAARRFETFGLLPSSGARAFYQRLQDDFKNPEKFAASVGVPSRQDLVIATSPMLMESAAEKVRTGELSLGKAAELLNVPISAIVVANSEISA